MRLHLGENSRMALNTVREHKARSFLTVLGVVIGVAAMIFVASILVGVNRSIEDYLNDYGTNTLFIFRFEVALRSGRVTAEEHARKPLTLEDAEAIQSECPSVKNVAAEITSRSSLDSPRRTPPSARYGGHEVTGVNF